MTEKAPNKKSVEFRPIPFQNDDPINVFPEKIGNVLVALQPKLPLYYAVYRI